MGGTDEISSLESQRLQFDKLSHEQLVLTTLRHIIFRLQQYLYKDKLEYAFKKLHALRSIYLRKRLVHALMTTLSTRDAEHAEVVAAQSKLHADALSKQEIDARATLEAALHKQRCKHAVVIKAQAKQQIEALAVAVQRSKIEASQGMEAILSQNDAALRCWCEKKAGEGCLVASPKANRTCLVPCVMILVNSRERRYV